MIQDQAKDASKYMLMLKDLRGQSKRSGRLEVHHSLYVYMVMIVACLTTCRCIHDMSDWDNDAHV